MRRLFHIARTCILLMVVSAASAQDLPATADASSILAAARDLAEKAAGLDRLLLRHNVAFIVRRLRLESAFGSYVTDAFNEFEQKSAPKNFLLDWQKNREEELAAKQLFLSGDEQGAKEQLRQCRFIPHYDQCLWRGDWGLQFSFLMWDLEAQNLQAALNRFRAFDWKAFESIVALHVARGYVVAGRRSEIPELMAEIDLRFQYAAEHGLLGDGAKLRNLVKTGDTGAAIQQALNRAKLSERVAGLCIIAEAVNGVPGPPDEGLNVF
jgi:hypothetical protein